jgi:hypothetical protein
MATRTRKPVVKTEANKKKRNVKKDTADIVEKALLGYSAARSKVDVIKNWDSDDRLISNKELNVMLKRIRNAQKSLLAAKSLVSILRRTVYRDVMLASLKEWGVILDKAWDDIIDNLDDMEE